MYFLGLQPMGHVDFYPNGGLFQPGCINPIPPLAFWDIPIEAFHLLSCSHGRARELFRDYLVSSCPAVAYECPDYNTFQRVMHDLYYDLLFIRIVFSYASWCVFYILFRETVILVAPVITSAFRLDCRPTSIPTKQERMFSFTTPHQILLHFAVC